MSNGRLTVASLFAGMGGFALAFKRQGYRPTWANEIDKWAASTYRKLHPESVMVHGDVREFSPVSMGLVAPDVLTAGFPCQPFSSAGDRLGLKDERGQLYKEIARILKEYGENRPPIVLLENVANLVGHGGGRTYPMVENELKAAGYWLLPHNMRKLNTKDVTDIPQNRERVFIVALATNAYRGGSFAFPEPIVEKREVRSFLNLDQRAEDYYYFDTEANTYGRMIHECTQGGLQDSVYQLRRSYVREHKEFVPTLTANMGVGGHNVPVIIDRWGLRKMTPRECGRLQGYNDDELDFPEDVTRPQQYKQIGNTVTVPLVEKLAVSCAKMLEMLRAGSTV